LLNTLILLAVALTLPDEAISVRIPHVNRSPHIEDYFEGRAQGDTAEITDFRQRDPNDGVAATYATAAYLSHDDKNLYIIFVCHDMPGSVRAHMAKREDIADDDSVSVYLDTFRDRQRAYVFSVNPLGVQRDGIQTEGSGKIDYSYDTLWSSEGRLTNFGYVVSISVPFKSLRFPAEAQQWGIALGRSTRRLSENSFWPHITTRIEGFAQQMASLERLDIISPGRNISFIPYASFSGARFLVTKPPTYRTGTDLRGGFDAKVVLSKAFTLDLTVNPDFSQVESDEPQVTINKRFEVNFPEKRPFFIENAGFFRTPEELFFSRRIIDPQFGARLTGKVGRWTIGALAADDRAPGQRASAGTPGFGQRAIIEVGRVQREFGKQNRLGVFASNLDFSWKASRIFAIDTRLKLTPNVVFTGQGIGSYNRTLDKTHFTGTAYMASLEYSGRPFRTEWLLYRSQSRF
jgi:hypothetical protein